MFLVVVRALVEATAGAQAASVTGLSAADLRHRLQGALPRVLMSDADGDRLAAISERLDQLGFITLVCDPRLAPADADRVLAKSFRIEPDQLVAVDAGGGEHDVSWTAIEAIQRGSRTHIQKIEEKTVTQKFDATRAVLSGGLILTKKHEIVTVRQTETAEPFALVQRGDGEPDVMLYERRMDYRALGRDMQPSSRANLEALVKRIRAAAPAAIYDERVARPGFLTALPSSSVDPVDLALHLVSLALRRGVR
jgi:hypothetical protein